MNFFRTQFYRDACMAIQFIIRPRSGWACTHTHIHLSSCTKQMFSVGFLIVLFTSVISSIAHVFYLTQILNLEEPPPKTFINPSSEVKQQQARKAGNTSVSSPSDAPSSSHTVSSNNTPGPSTPNQETASPNQGYLAQGRGSFQASKKRKSSAIVRRLTSHSLLSQNSITSSSFDPSDEFLFPE